MAVLEDMRDKEIPIVPSHYQLFLTKFKRVAQSRYGTSFLALISFVESFLPVPLLTDPFLAVAILANRAEAKKLVLITLLSSVLGGLSAFLVATYFREWLLSALSPEAIEVLNSLIGANEGTLILTLLGAVTPIPYTIVAWAVALSGGNPVVFILASLLGRGLRYSIVGWCAYVFGPAALKYAKRSILITSLVLLVLAALYVWLKL